MLSRLRTIFTIPELRQKILITLILLAVYRMGFSIMLPFIDQEAFAESFKKMQSQAGIGQFMQAVALLSASGRGNATIFGLGIMPYISASIIFQLLGQVYPPLEQLQKEGETGRKKINEYTRYATVLIALGQSYFWINMLANNRLGMGQGVILDAYDTWFYRLVATLTMTAGTMLLMWIGEQIDEYGVGNGISLLIMAGILAQMPAAGLELLRPALKEGIGLGTAGGIDKLLPLAILFVAVVMGVIAITQAQRRIPIQSAKHVRGRRVLGGQKQFLPLRVNQAGVMPIIFASSLLMIPMFVFTWLSQMFPGSSMLSAFANTFGGSGRGLSYNLLFILLIYFFCYFWTSITFNPKDMAENLKDYGSFVPGYRPGSHTEKYLDQVMVRITYVGAGFLALIAVIPTAVASGMDISFLIASFYGGTGLLIVVSVALDLVQKIDSHLVMRNKAGLLDSEDV
ncbi:preprotein translocase subunit SecY [Planctomicrobium sp. SH664]|uniref:preprotein translocase subunit SecY n=1 Tax=Planctomicrobium sp. SH664 TaxID=3448125 RepID=UPI003F5C9BB1